MKHADALIEESGGGSIVNLCSILGTVGGLGNGLAYSAAKGAVRTMTANAALHRARKEVRVFRSTRGSSRPNSCSSGTRAPSGIGGCWPVPMGRLGRVTEVAAAEAFLAGDDSAARHRYGIVCGRRLDLRMSARPGHLRRMRVKMSGFSRVAR